MAKITISNGGLTFDCVDDTIMRAATRAGLGFPYECNVGECGNCRFELQEGEVSYLRENPPAITERDAQRKRYLGCQAAPHGDCVIKVPLRDHYKSKHLPKKVQGELIAAMDVTHDIREFRFRLSEPAPFLAGQYALLSPPGVEGGRAYSMCNTGETGEEWHFQIRRVPNGVATTAMFDRLKVGESMGFDGPYGMAYLREDAPRDVLCLAGGSGLSPMISISRAAAKSPALAGRNIHFVYGGRTPRDVCGEQMLCELAGFGERIHYHAAISMPDDPASAGWKGEVGFVHEVAERMFGERLADYEVYFAGPPLMAQAVTKMLIKAKVPAGQMHFDQFY
ncbi:MAG TPA: 2Fe-2S iron-sulfur cluster-binding protein [Beijerinckiaceae bacterium]|jgi:toluene monooxygenase electron transfer component